LAIENIWIIDSNSGICIFDWYTKSKEKTIDEQLVSGLLLAFRSFSSEAGLVDISAIEGLNKKLAYKSDERFIVAAICHLNDYEPLVNKTILGLLEDFRKKYKDLIDDDATTDVSPFRTFAEDIESKLEGTTSARNVTTLLVGSIITMMLVGVVFAIYAIFIDNLELALPDSFSLLGLVILLIGFILSGFIGVIIAGDRRFGLYAGIFATLPVIGLFIAFFQSGWGTIGNIIVTSILFLLIFLVMICAGSLIGGYIKEQRFMYPLDMEEIDEE